MDALQNYLLAFRRADLPRIGPLDEHYRFYRILDLDLSYTIRERVGRVVSLGHLPIVRHRHALWEALSDGDREERSRKNFGRFLKRWDHGHRLERHGDPAHAEHAARSTVSPPVLRPACGACMRLPGPRPRRPRRPVLCAVVQFSCVTRSGGPRAA